MRKRIVWLDNDLAYITPFIVSLEETGYEVTHFSTVSGAEDFIRNNQPDLLILDVMIPTKTADEEIIYSPDETDFGHQTGLVFYRRMKTKLDADRIPVLVMTVRLDKGLTNDFIAAGLSEDSFYTKMALSEIPIFLDKIKEMLGELQN